MHNVSKLRMLSWVLRKDDAINTPQTEFRHTDLKWRISVLSNCFAPHIAQIYI